MSMKVGIYVLFFWVLVSVLHAQIGDPNSAENKKWWNGEHHYKLQLRNEPLTLQDCLDAGIRPRHTPGMAGHTLHFQAKKFELVLHNGESIFGENGYGRIKVTKDYQVTSISFYEESFVGFETCRDRLVKSNQAYRGNTTQAEIDSFMSSAEVAERYRTDKIFGVGMPTKGVARNEYWYSSIVARNTGYVPRATKIVDARPFRFIIRTEIRDKANKRSYKDYHPLGVLLAPPEGYEHISFTYVSPPKDPNAPLILTPQEQSKLLAEQLKKDTKGSIDSSQEPQTSRKIEPSLSPQVVAEKTIEPEKKSSLPWIIAGVLLVGILALLLKIFKGKSTS